jgi:hypothetical protein
MGRQAIRPQIIAALLIVPVTIVAFQNCADDKAFSKLNSASKVVDSGESEPQGPITLPPPDPREPLEPKEETPAKREPTDTNHEGKPIKFGCVTGADLSLDDLNPDPSLTAADDRSVHNAKYTEASPLEIGKARNVSLHNVKGPVFVENAQSADLHNISNHAMSSSRIRVAAHELKGHNLRLHTKAFALPLGFTSLRSQRTSELTNVDSLVTAMASREVGRVHNVRGAALCLSGQSIEEVSNVNALLTKIMGRSDGQTKASAGRIQNVAGLLSLANLDVGLIHNVFGGILIRDGNVGELSNVKGVIYLENSKVTTLKNFKGKIILKDSVIENQHNVHAEIVQR